VGIVSRMHLIFNAKSSAALDSVEDPVEIMEYGYQQQQELLQKVRRGLVEVATSKKQLEQQAAQLRAKAPRMDDQAKRAMAAGREDLARISLERKHTALGELAELERQLSDVAADQQRLQTAQSQLSDRIERYKTHKDITTARYSAAAAQVRVNEALVGIGGELAELSMALGRAEEKTSRMIARASAIDALIETGALDAPTSHDRVEDELRRTATEQQIEADLAALKAQVQKEKPA